MDGKEKPLLMVFPMDLASHYLRCVSLCQRLAAEFKIEIAFSEEYRQFTEAANIETFPVSKFGRERIKKSAAAFDFSWLNQGDLKAIMDSQVEIIRERKPFAVLGDTSFTLKMASEKTGVRYISLLNSYMTKHFGLWRGVPRSHPGFKFSKTLPPKLFEIIAREMEYRTLRAVHEPFRNLRETEGLGTTEYLLDELEGDLNLICDLPDLFPLNGAPKNYRWVGPLFHVGEREEPEAMRFLEGSGKNILVTTGSSGEWAKFSFLEDARFAKYRFLLSGNGGCGIKPRNSLSQPFLNAFTVLPRIDLVICHGGNGTIYQSLSHGIPVICMPANFECEWNSYRIQAAGLGEVIDDRFDPSALEASIDAWITKRGSSVFQKTSSEIAGYHVSPLKILPIP